MQNKWLNCMNNPFWCILLRKLSPWWSSVLWANESRREKSGDSNVKMRFSSLKPYFKHWSVCVFVRQYNPCIISYHEFKMDLPRICNQQNMKINCNYRGMSHRNNKPTLLSGLVLFFSCLFNQYPTKSKHFIHYVRTINY